MDYLNGRDDGDDEIALDPRPLPGIAIVRAASAIAGRLRRALLVEGKRRPTRPGWLLAVIAVIIVVGALKVADVIWTSAPPIWVPALGPDVKVTGPGQVAPGHGSPGAAFAGALAALSSADPATACNYTYADAGCTAALSRTPQKQRAHGVSVRIGYVAIDGSRALLGFTGKICLTGARPECITNTDPAAIFSTGSTFEVLWTQAVGPDRGPGYGLQPLTEVGGKWYLGADPSEDES
jgi:hypothetical protein